MKIVGRPLACSVWGGRLFGTTKNAGAPDEPATRRVHLLNAEVQSLISVQATPLGETTISSDSGYWEFKNLDPSKKYHVIAYDHTGQYDPVVKMNLIPTVD